MRLYPLANALVALKAVVNTAPNAVPIELWTACMKAAITLEQALEEDGTIISIEADDGKGEEA